MATSLSYDQAFQADPAAVMAMLIDPEYVRRKGERTGAFDITVDVAEAPDGGAVITCTRSMPAEVPSYAAPFVGDTITITETQAWGPAAADGSRTADVTVDFNSPLAYRGTIELVASGDGSIARNAGEFKASVPFVGGKVEDLARQQTERYLRKEQAIAAEWLSR